jgi:amino acid adenylation domain-containing protein/non-ribosomal peptide synthase protein (TIGR01720 family)
VIEYGVESGISKFDLTFNFEEQGSEILIVIEYNTDLFSQEQVERMLEHYQNLLKDIITGNNKSIDNFTILSNEEIRRIMLDFNSTKKDIPYDTLIDMFRDTVNRLPNFIATVYKDKNLTYLQLDRRSSQLASHLQQTHEIKPGDLVGVLMAKSDDFIVSILAILKVGAAYVPIDPQTPQERIAFIIDDAAVKLLITSKKSLSDSTLVYQEKTVILDNDWEDVLKGNELFKEVPVTGQSLAYVIYTSGSTGTPKGVAISQYSLLNYVSWFSDTYGINEYDRTLLISSVAFDLSYTSLWPALLRGASIYVWEEQEYLETKALVEALIKYQITYIKLTPSHFSIIVSDIDFINDSKKYALRLVVMGGEEINTTDVQSFISQRPDVTFVNHYGPTETTIGTIAETINGNKKGRDQDQTFDYIKNKKVIGRPISNNQVYILNSMQQVQPIGVVGEICISGAGVGRGYLNREELTAQKFVMNMFGNRMYRSGDLGRWTNDGKIEFFGRKDNQIKIKGYRIELGDIESRLKLYKLIVEAVVVVKSDANTNKLLIAYVVGSEPINQVELMDYLRLYLPHYMIPASFVQVGHMPLTKNGKIDRKELANRDVVHHDAGLEKFVPENEEEIMLADAWKDVFGKDFIAINDNFFASGGDSIKAIQISARMHREGYRLPVKNIFQGSSIREISLAVRKITRVADQSPVKGQIPLTPIQREFFQTTKVEEWHYNQSITLYFTESVDVEVITTIFNRLLRHHDMLRAFFPAQEGEYLQCIADDTHVVVTDHDIMNQDNFLEVMQEIANDLNAQFYLSAAPLVKLALFRCKDGDRLLIIVHHLIMDGVSWRILLEDFQLLLDQGNTGKGFELPLKTDSFKSWSDALSEYAESETIRMEAEYWLKVIRSQVKLLKRDHESYDNLVKDASFISFRLTKKETESLLYEINKAFNVEINDILLSALAIALKDCFEMENVLVTLEGHGREQIFEEINNDRTIGWYTSFFPVLLDSYHSNNISRLIIDVKEMLRNIPKKGLGFGILKHLAHDSIRQKFHSVKPEICFNYLGQFDKFVGNATFEILSEEIGNVQSANAERKHEFDISGLIHDGILSMTITYNTRHHGESTVQQFWNYYKECLIQIIHHCSSQHQKELTPSDFTHKELTIDELESIKALYN